MAFFSRKSNLIPQNQWGSVGGMSSSSLQRESTASRLISGVYTWMAAGVGLTGLVAFALVSSGLLQEAFANFGRVALYGVLILQLGLVFTLSLAAQKLSLGATRALFLVYSATTGITVGAASLVFTTASMATIFGVAAAAFVGLAVFGAVTKKNLGFMGTFLIMGLWMVIGMAVVNIFMQSAMLSYVGNWIGVLVFSGLTAWESQKIRQMALQMSPHGEATGKFMVHGALTMYLNFLNLFFSLLNLFGDRRS